MWRLRQIGEGRMDARTACIIIPSEADLLASEVAFLQEVEQAKREIAAKKGVAKPAQTKTAPQDIIFEDGKAILSPHVHVAMPVSTMRLTFQGEKRLISRRTLNSSGWTRKDSASLITRS